MNQFLLFGTLYIATTEFITNCLFISKMNPLTNVKNIIKLNETELSTGLIHKKSWHDIYKDSAWIFIGGLEYGLTEGDVLTVFSQYGEIVNINLVRDKKTGKSKGFCFLCYANQKSTVLAVDNLNGIKLCNRTIRVDHVENYKPPKENDKDDEITKMLKSQGCAPEILPKSESEEVEAKKKSKKEKKEKKKKKKQKNNSDDTDSEKVIVGMTDVRVKKERHDPGYDKYDTSSNRNQDLNKRKHQKDSLGDSKGESSHTGENYQSKRHHSSRDSFVDKSKLHMKRELESDNDSNTHHSSSKKRKRQRSSSSDHHVSTTRDDNNGHRKDKTGPKKHSNHTKHYKSNVSSSSSDDGSSTQSSEDERPSNQTKYSTKDKNKQYGEKTRSFEEENRDRNYDKSKSSDHMPTKSQHFSKEKKHSKHKSKTKYRSDDSDDSRHINSHHYKSKCSKK